MTYGSVFIEKDRNTVVIVEELYSDHFTFRYIVTDSPAHLGKTDWAFYANFRDGRWEQIA